MSGNWRGRDEDRVRQRAMPIANSILWKPLRDSHYILAALQPDWSGLRQLFVRQSVLVEIQSLTRSIADNAPLGLLLGRQWHCPNAGLTYVTVDSVLPAPDTVSDVVPMTTALRGLLDRGPGDPSVECVGWYSRSQFSECQLAALQRTVHAALFSSPWHTALILGAQKNAGGFFLYDARKFRWYLSPFYELGDEKATHPTPKATCISWPDYLTKDTTTPLAPEPPATSPVERSPAPQVEREPLADHVTAESPPVEHPATDVTSVSVQRRQPKFELAKAAASSLGAIGRLASRAVRAVANIIERYRSKPATVVTILTIRKPELGGARQPDERQIAEAAVEREPVQDFAGGEEARALAAREAARALEEQEHDAVRALRQAAREKAARVLAAREAARALEEQEHDAVRALRRAARDKAAIVLAVREAARELEEQEHDAVRALRRAAREKAARLLAAREQTPQEQAERVAAERLAAEDEARRHAESEQARLEELARLQQAREAEQARQREEARRVEEARRQADGRLQERARLEEDAARERALRDIAAEQLAAAAHRAASQERVVPRPAPKELADRPPNADELAARRAARRTARLPHDDIPLASAPRPSRTPADQAGSSPSKMAVPQLGDLEDTTAADQPYRYLALARREGFVVTANDARGTEDHPETVWRLNEQTLGLQLTVVTSDDGVREATLEYSVRAGTDAVAPPGSEDEDDSVPTIVVREPCLEGLRARCRRLRDTAMPNEEEESTSPPLHLSTGLARRDR